MLPLLIEAGSLVAGIFTAASMVERGADGEAGASVGVPSSPLGPLKGAPQCPPGMIPYYNGDTAEWSCVWPARDMPRPAPSASPPISPYPVQQRIGRSPPELLTPPLASRIPIGTPPPPRGPYPPAELDTTFSRTIPRRFWPYLPHDPIGQAGAFVQAGAAPAAPDGSIAASQIPSINGGAPFCPPNWTLIGGGEFAARCFPPKPQPTYTRIRLKTLRPAAPVMLPASPIAPMPVDAPAPLALPIAPPPPQPVMSLPPMRIMSTPAPAPAPGGGSSALPIVAGGVVLLLLYFGRKKQRGR